MNKTIIATFGILNFLIISLAVLAAYEFGQVQRWQFGYQLMQETADDLVQSVTNHRHVSLVCTKPLVTNPYRILPKHMEGE